MTIGGPVADLDRLSGSTLVLNVDVSGLDVGTHEVTATANLVTGLTLVGANPNPITVTIGSLATPCAARRLPVARPAGQASVAVDANPGGTDRGTSVEPHPEDPGLVARLFGTDGIRGVANVDLRPTIGLCPRSGNRVPARERPAADRGGPGHAPLRRHVRGGDHGRCDEPRQRRARRRGRPDAGPCLPRRAWRVRRRDHGLGVPQSGGRQRPEGARRRRAQARRSRRGRARAAHLADRGARRRRQRRAGRGGRCLGARRRLRSRPHATGSGRRCAAGSG